MSRFQRMNAIAKHRTDSIEFNVKSRRNTSVQRGVLGYLSPKSLLPVRAAGPAPFGIPATSMCCLCNTAEFLRPGSF